MVKYPPANAGDTGDMGSIPGSGRSPRKRNGNPLQYSCLEYPTDREVQWPRPMGSPGVGHNLASKQQGNEGLRGETLPISSNKAVQAFHSNLQGEGGLSYPHSKLPQTCLSRQRNKASSRGTMAQTGLATSLLALRGGAGGVGYPKPTKPRWESRYRRGCSGE